MEPHEIILKILHVEEADVDAMWSVVQQKTLQRWLWQAIEHRMGEGFAEVLGTHQAEGLCR